MAKLKTTSETTASVKEPIMSEVTSTDEVEIKVCKKVDKLEASFGNGELNQVVEKLNEVIEVLNKCQ